MVNIQELLRLDGDNNAVRFIADRILLDDYRGLQFSQHNRYTRDDVKNMLSAIYETTGESEMLIRTTDLVKRPYSLPEEHNYVKFVKLVKSTIGKGTEDSIRKNYFVDFHRMGFIDRFDKNFNKLDPFERKSCKYVKLSMLGLMLINAENIFVQNLIYTQGLDNILGNLIHDVMDIISQKKQQNTLSIQEYTYFVSFLGKRMNDHTYEVSDIVSLLNEYNELPRAKKDYIDDFLKKYCDPSKFSGDKTDKRDYHNWINESQQVFMLLGQTVYFENDKKQLVPRVGNDDNCVFDDIKKFKRSAAVKSDYFREHNIDKQLGFELHHIMALNLAKNRNEFVLLDNWQNLIYIDGKTHSILSQTGNINNILKANNEDLVLYDYKNESLYLHKDKEVLYKVELQHLMIEYNQQLRKI